MPSSCVGCRDSIDVCRVDGAIALSRSIHPKPKNQASPLKPQNSYGRLPPRSSECARSLGIVARPPAVARRLAMMRWSNGPQPRRTLSLLLSQPPEEHCQPPVVDGSPLLLPLAAAWAPVTTPRSRACPCAFDPRSIQRPPSLAIGLSASVGVSVAAAGGDGWLWGRRLRLSRFPPRPPHHPSTHRPSLVSSAQRGGPTATALLWPGIHAPD